MTRIRAGNPVLRRRQFFQGRPICGDSAKDIVWFTRDGRAMTDADWNATRARVLGVCLNGQMDEFDERGRPIAGTTLLFFFSAEDRQLQLSLPHLSNAAIGTCCSTPVGQNGCPNDSPVAAVTHWQAARAWPSKCDARCAGALQQLITQSVDSMPRRSANHAPEPPRQTNSNRTLEKPRSSSCLLQRSMAELVLRVRPLAPATDNQRQQQAQH